MKRSLILALLMVSAGLLKSQQDPQNTQWMFDKLSFNPAAAGIEGMHCGTMFYRDQWDGFDRDPKTALFNYSGYFEGLSGGLGVTFYNDILGQERNTIIRLAYAYHGALSNGNKIAVGLAVGSYAKRLENKWIAIDDFTSDSAIPNEVSSASSVDINFGGIFYKPDNYYVGLSATHLTGQDLKDLSITVARHYYFMGGYNFNDIADGLDLRTNLLAKSDFNASILDINANVLWNKMVWAGVSFRPSDAIAPMVGMQIPFENGSATQGSQSMLTLGYSYDLTTSEIKNYSSGSHEIFLKYCVKFWNNPPQNRHANPRFL